MALLYTHQFILFSWDKTQLREFCLLTTIPSVSFFVHYVIDAIFRTTLPRPFFFFSLNVSAVISSDGQNTRKHQFVISVVCLFTQHKKALVRRFTRVAFYPQPPVLPPPVGDSAHFSRRLPTIARLIRRISNLLCFSMFLLINFCHTRSLLMNSFMEFFLFKVSILCEFLAFYVKLSDP